MVYYAVSQNIKTLLERSDDRILIQYLDYFVIIKTSKTHDLVSSNRLVE